MLKDKIFKKKLKIKKKIPESTLINLSNPQPNSFYLDNLIECELKQLCNSIFNQHNIK